MLVLHPSCCISGCLPEQRRDCGFFVGTWSESIPLWRFWQHAIGLCQVLWIREHCAHVGGILRSTATEHSLYTVRIKIAQTVHSPLFFREIVASIVEFDGPSYWCLDASETGESTKYPWVGVVEGTTNAFNPSNPTHGRFVPFPVSLTPRDQDGGQSDSTIDIYDLTEK